MSNLLETDNSTPVNLPEIKSEGAQKLSELTAEERIARLKGMDMLKRKKEESPANQRVFSLKNRSGNIKSSSTSSLPVDTNKTSQEQKIDNLEQDRKRAALIKSSLNRVKVNPLVEQLELEEMERQRLQKENYNMAITVITGIVLLGGYLYYKRFFEIPLPVVVIPRP